MLPVRERPSFNHQHTSDEPVNPRNQLDFPLLIVNLIAAFFGYNADQVGSGLAQLWTALRAEDGSIVHDQYVRSSLHHFSTLMHTRYTIRLRDGAPSFDLYAGGPKQDEIDRWSQFVDAYLRASTCSNRLHQALICF